MVIRKNIKNDQTSAVAASLLPLEKAKTVKTDVTAFLAYNKRQESSGTEFDAS